MEVRPLGEVELRDALGPVNRGQGGLGQFVPAVRTAAQLRDRIAAEVLDPKLSLALYMGGALVGACLVERLDASAHIDALGVEPLAQQRGGGRALLDALCKSGAAAGIRQLSIFVSEFDRTVLSTVQALGFTRRRTVTRYLLGGAPSPLPQPPDLGSEAPPPDGQGAYARAVPLAEALPLVAAVPPEQLVFFQQPAVLTRLHKRLTAYVHVAPGAAPAAAVFERERKLLYALGGETETLAPLLCLLGSRYGIACIDAVVEGHPAEAALVAAGFVRATVRAELVKDLG